MSTRSQIAIYESDTIKDLKNWYSLFYRHSDGYPGDLDLGKYGVLIDLVPFLQEFRGNRGHDPEYLGARLIQRLTNELDRRSREYQKTTSHDLTEPFRFTGYGVSKYFAGDIEYFYAVHPSRVDVYKTPFGSEPAQWEKINSVLLTDA